MAQISCWEYLELAEGYNRVEDRIERRMRNDYMWAEEGDEEIMAIPVSLYASLVNKAEKYDQLIAKMKEVEGEPSRSTGGALPRLPQIPSNIGGGGDPPGPPPPPQGGSGAAKVRRDPGDPTTRKKGGSVYEAERDFLPEELGNGCVSLSKMPPGPGYTLKFDEPCEKVPQRHI